MTPEKRVSWAGSLCGTGSSRNTSIKRLVNEEPQSKLGADFNSYEILVEEGNVGRLAFAVCSSRLTSCSTQALDPLPSAKSVITAPAPEPLWRHIRLRV